MLTSASAVRSGLEMAVLKGFHSGTSLKSCSSQGGASNAASPPEADCSWSTSNSWSHSSSDGSESSSLCLFANPDLGL